MAVRFTVRVIGALGFVQTMVAAGEGVGEGEGVGLDAGVGINVEVGVGLTAGVSAWVGAGLSGDDTGLTVGDDGARDP